MNNYKPDIYVNGKIMEGIKSIVIIPDKMEPSVNIVLDGKKTISGRLLTVKHYDAKIRLLISTMTEMEELQDDLSELEQKLSPLNDKKKQLQEKMAQIEQSSKSISER